MIKYSILRSRVTMKKIKKYLAVCSLFTALIICSCDDMANKVGSSVIPPAELITVYADTFQLESQTIKLDSVFAKSSDFLLGELYDPLYGNIKADALCQFYCEEGFRFSNSPFEGIIDSVELVIRYPYSSTNSLTAYGDTMTSMQVSVYPIDKPLKRNFYSNENPENYCEMNNPLGKKTYSAYDVSISDSIRAIIAVDNKNYYIPHVKVKLPTELGQRIYDETINNPSTFESQSSFNEFFPGVYITNTYGSGCVIKTTSENVYIKVYYNYETKSLSGNDSLALGEEWFFVSKEVIQLNRLENSKLDVLLTENPNQTFIKSPAGVCTKLVIPTIDISKKVDVEDRYINSFNLELKYLPEDEWDYAFKVPDHLLLLPEDSVITFFENGKVEDNITSFVSFSYSEAAGYLSSNNIFNGYSPVTRTYSFGNISSLLITHIKNSPDKDLSLLVLPVVRSGASSQGGIYTTRITNSFDLSGVKIRKEENFLKAIVLSSKFENK